AEAQSLERYFIDVHSQLLDEIAGIAGDEGEVIEFAYDWRHDIDQIAGWLDKTLREKWRDKIRGARLTIVAHSMGGVVAWVWKNRYYHRDEKDFELSRLVLLGSPLQGSCDMLRMLLEGYRSTPTE